MLVFFHVKELLVSAICVKVYSDTCGCEDVKQPTYSLLRSLESCT